MTHLKHNEVLARRIVLISGFAAFIIFGIRLSFSVFYAEFITSEGWSNEAAAGIFSISMLVFAFGSTPAGILLDRYGPRAVFTVGSILLACGLFLSSRAENIQQLSIAYGLVGGSGLAIIGLGPLAANIAAWVPPAQRGRAIGIAFAGTGFGSLIFVPLSTQLIARFGWRNAYVILGCVVLFILSPLLALILRAPPKTLDRAKGRTQKPSHRSTLFLNPIFWLLLFVAMAALGPLRALSVHQVAYIEAVGIDRQTAANYVGFAGFLTAGTFIGWGIISDRYGRSVAFGLGAICMMIGVGILFLLSKENYVFLLPVYATLLALGEGTRSSQTTAIASDIFQDSGLGFINGIVGAMFGLGAAFGPWIVGKLVDRTGSYTPGLTAIFIMIVLSFVGFILVEYLYKRSR